MPTRDARVRRKAACSPLFNTATSVLRVGLPCRTLLAQSYTNLVLRTHAELELLDQAATARFFAEERPEVVFLAAAKVGGIHANNVCRAEFIYDNLMVQANVLHQAYLAGVRRLLFLGSSCIYPQLAPQPIQEDALLTGPLEPTNSPYAIAKNFKV